MTQTFLKGLYNRKSSIYSEAAVWLIPVVMYLLPENQIFSEPFICDSEKKG